MKFCFLALLVSGAVVAASPAKQSPPFEVGAVLDPAATKQLKEAGESVVVDVSFTSDDPTDGSPVKPISLQRELGPEGGKARVAPVKITPQHTMVSIQVFSSRKKRQTNLLNCQSMDVEVAKAKGETFLVKCGLIR